MSPSARASGSVATSATRGRSACVSASSSGVRCFVGSVAFAKHCVPVAVQLAKSEGCVAGVAMDGVIQESPLKKGRVHPENFVCQTLEELIEWMDARQSDMRVAVEVGNVSEVSKLAAMLVEGSS